MDYEKKIEIPFGAFDSELYYQELNIPDGFEATIKDNKIILKRKDSKDDRIRKAIIEHIKGLRYYDSYYGVTPDEMIAWLEKQGNPADKTDVVDTPPFKASDWYVSKVDGKIHDMTHSPNNEDKQTNVEESTMTIEQERLFEKNVWDYHITENTAEYEIAKYFFVLGLKSREE